MKKFRSLIKYILICISTIGLYISCKKSGSLTEEERVEQQRKADAAFNHKQIAGVGNVFYEKQLLPDQAAQLVFKIVYGEDTLAGYAKTDALGRVTFISATVLLLKGGKDAVVSEIFPEQSKSRIYTITDNKKNGLALEIWNGGLFDTEVAILDESEAGNLKVLKSAYFNNGEQLSGYSTFRTDGSKNVWNCDKAQPSDDLDQSVDNHLQHHECGGLAWETYPQLKFIKDAFLAALESLKSLEQYKDKLAELELLKTARSKMARLLESLSGKLIGLRSEEVEMEGVLKQLGLKIVQLEEEVAKNNLMPVLEPYASDLDYDEVTDVYAKFTYVITNTESNLPYVGRPVYLEFQLLDPVTKEPVYRSVKATSIVNGLVSFEVNPLIILDHDTYGTLEVRCNPAKDPSHYSSTTLKLSYIIPKLAFSNGNTPPAVIPFIHNSALSFKLINQDGRSIPIDYNLVSLVNNSNSKVVLKKADNLTEFSITLSTDETTTQQASFDIIYKSQKVQTVWATLNDSIGIYRAGCVGWWTVKGHDPNNPTTTYILELFANGTGKYYINGVTYNTSWSVRRSGNSYKLFESGFWHPAYDNLSRDKLTYPITKFKTYANFDPNFVSQEYIKN